MDSVADTNQSLTQATRSARPLPVKLIGGLLVAAAVLVMMEGVARCVLPASQATRFQQINQIVVFLGTHESDLMLDYDPERFWKLKPNITITDPNNTVWQGQVSNSLGFRCPEFSLQKTPGTIRIVCFGDSSTFGIGATMEDTWPSQLQSMLHDDESLTLDADMSRYEVINAGVPGYTSYQGLKFMQQEIDRLQPDIVMASYANNDFWHWDQQTDEQHALRLNDSAGIRHVLQRSSLVQLIDSVAGSLRPSNVETSPARTASPNQHWAATATHNYVQPVDEWTRRVPLDAFRRNINHMADLCAVRALPLILVKWPDQPQAGGHWSPRIAYQEVLDEISLQRGLQVADVVSLFQENRGWSVRTYVPNDIVHVNRSGNALAAIAARDAIDRLESQQRLNTN